MSMIEGMFERCVALRQQTDADGVGGWDGAWQEGESFDAAILKDGETAETEGQRQVLRERFTAVVPKGVALGFHDVFRRLSDGAVFRVTGDGRDAAAPEESTVMIAKVKCERWVLT